MKELDLFPMSDTCIKCNLPGGHTIELDAIEVDWMLQQVWIGKPKDVSAATIMKEMVQRFKDEYGFTMSLSSMNALLNAKDQVIEAAKKNISQSSEPLDSMESSSRQKPDEN